MSVGKMNTDKAMVKVRDQPMLEANAIHPKSEDWTVLIQVMERRKPRKSKGLTDFRSYTATDMKGTKIPLVAFARDVFNFEDTLLPYNRYKVSNAIVKITPPAYKTFEYPYTWTVHKKIIIEPYPDAIPHPLPCSFSFDKFSDFYMYADQPREICIKAMIVYAFPIQVSTKQSSYRDYIVVNEEMIPVLLRVWDDLLADSDVNVYAKYKNPTMIVAYGLRVTTHNCLSLGTKDYVYFMQNPPLNETCPLKDWYVANSEEVQKMVATRSYRDTAVLFHPPRRGKILSLDHALATMENVKTVWTEGMLTLVPGQRKLWLQACEKCYNEVHAGTNSNIWCMTCKELSDIIIRGNVIVYLKNGARTIQATIKSPDIDQLLPFTPQEMMEADVQGLSITEEVEAALRDKHVICFMKYYDQQTNTGPIRRYPILKIYSEADILAYNGDGGPEATEETQSSTVLISGSANQGSSSSNAAGITVQDQFFTPTTKDVLENIMQSPSLDDILSERSTGVKRVLNFEETPDKAMDPNVSEREDTMSPKRTPKTEGAGPSITAQSPTPKKSKGKGHKE